jgi:hypothetical protein
MSDTFSVPLPNDVYEVEVAVDNSSGTAEVGPMWLEANGRDLSDLFSVPPGQAITKKLVTRVADNQLHMAFSAVTSRKWRVSSLVIRQAGPRIAHVPVRRLSPGEDLRVFATVSGSPKQVRIVYASPASGFVSKDLASTGAGTWRATVPAAQIRDGFSYYLEAAEGHTRTTFPVGDGQHQIVVRMSSDASAPTVRHEAITSATPGSPITISADVRDGSGVEWARVRYRSVNQHQDFHTLPLLPTGRPHEYRAVIPGEDVDARWDFMYYLETMDRAGNGAIYPNLDQQTPYVVVRLHR